MTTQKPINSKLNAALQVASVAVVAQASRQNSLKEKLTEVSVAVATSMALTLAIAPSDAHAQEVNQLKRAAQNTLGALIGGGIGSQFGKGNGKTLATGIGATTGVIITEELRGDSDQRRTNNSRYDNQGFGPRDFGPSGLNNSYNIGRANTSNAVLQSGPEPLSSDRLNKLTAKEQNFLAARDQFARAKYLALQAQDDAVLSPRNRQLEEISIHAANQEAATRNTYVEARNEFVSALEYFGNRGYDVQQFAYTYNLANRQVTSKDMSKRDLDSQVSRRLMNRIETETEKVSEYARH